MDDSACYQLHLAPYQHRFRTPLRTARGGWYTRQGLLVKLTARSGASGWGEIAPLPAFGSETLAQAQHFCAQLGRTVSAAQIVAIPDTLPACQFGFESAEADLHGAIASPDPPQSSIAKLLPAGAAALTAWEPAWQQGHRSFKWKVGVLPWVDEWALLRELTAALPPAARLRLDANASLELTAAEQWLQKTAELTAVEFLEQPLPPTELAALLTLSQRYPTPLALDESVATLTQLADCYQRGWRGIVVIKPAIAGSPRRLRQFCRQHSLDAVFSSVFETKVGRRAAIALAAELANPQRALGFGVETCDVPPGSC
ncbi:MAG: o-succinylbenzoate synthase [Spirulinaceae cyanobacterium SM2_1_0]|nr:o-succinylbenzoate synthase [Spirulinaceae cyanobacterium SM2_1_0]